MLRSNYMGSHAKSFEELRIFQQGRQMAAAIWKITRNGSFSTDRVLSGQIRRAGLSVISNIAEGFERGSRAEFGRFLKIAKGSWGEARAQNACCGEPELHHITKQQYEQFSFTTRQISAGLSNLARYLREHKESHLNISLVCKQPASDALTFPLFCYSIFYFPDQVVM